jgi:hypothetical protein
METYSSSADDSSDEEFLALGENREGKVDREALVRKKLLESFYGKSAVVAADYEPNPISLDDGDSEDEDSVEFKRSSRKLASSQDLDSPYFDAQAHTTKHIHASSVHELLETEERLALQVRTLDSTMQTLVYENYSRFIDATDAIKSIGVNVKANEDGLDRLASGMKRIHDTSKDVEDALGSLRDQVAEKIRVKRLLTRLDTLLKLPKTLQSQIGAGKYRSATRNYLSASSILGQHSKGFESLRNIEVECHEILVEMKEDLKRKLLQWSGHFQDVDQEDPNAEMGSIDGRTIDLPKNMTDIFECVGTLFILFNSDHAEDYLEADFSGDDLQSMAMSAAARTIERMLDAHVLEVQESRFEGAKDLTVSINLTNSFSHVESSQNQSEGSILVPSDVLDTILEVATLFGLTFGAAAESSYMIDFISKSFGYFLSHVRSVILEVGFEAASSEETTTRDDGNYTGDDVSTALATLMKAVRQLASGLALPDIGIGVDYASKLVDQAMALTESMVRRCVDRKFQELRLSVVTDCMLPFAERMQIERGNEFRRDAQQAILNSALSDCIQLIDDTIRSVLAEGREHSDSISAPDLPVLKDAVYSSVRRFASWLAGVFECLAGGDSCDATELLEVNLLTTEKDGDNEDHEGIDTMAGCFADAVSQNQSQTGIVQLVDSIVCKLQSISATTGRSMGDIGCTLAITQLCLLAEESVSDEIEESIQSYVGGGKKKSRGMFPTDASLSAEMKVSRADDIIARQFQLSSSRIIAQYAVYQGHQAADALTAGLLATNVSGKDFRNRPSDAAVKALEIARVTALDCYDVFGGRQRAGPVSYLADDSIPEFTKSVVGRKTGLQLDVERMFMDNVVSVLPHPGEIVDPSRNAVLYIFFKSAFRGFAEQVRVRTFSRDSFKQLQIDTEFLKHMLPHYIDESFSLEGSNACSALSNLLRELMNTVRERSLDNVYSEDESLVYQSRASVRSFLQSAAADDTSTMFIIREE